MHRGSMLQKCLDSQILTLVKTVKVPVKEGVGGGTITKIQENNTTGISPKFYFSLKSLTLRYILGLSFLQVESTSEDKLVHSTQRILYCTTPTCTINAFQVLYIPLYQKCQQHELLQFGDYFYLNNGRVNFILP